MTLELILAAIAAIGTLGGVLWGRRSGKKAAEGDRARKELEGVQRGTQGAREAKERLGKGETPDDLLRRNDGKW